MILTAVQKYIITRMLQGWTLESNNGSRNAYLMSKDRLKLKAVASRTIITMFRLDLLDGSSSAFALDCWKLSQLGEKALDGKRKSKRSLTRV